MNFQDNRVRFRELVEDLRATSVGEDDKEELFKVACSLLSPTSFNDRLRYYLHTATGGDIHYSQEGEDIIFDRLFSTRSNGFYVDVGAYHPTKYSNTFSLYKKGWSGINIDARPGVEEDFKSLRPRDITRQACICDLECWRCYYLFEQSALNTFNDRLAEKYIALGHHVLGKVDVRGSALKKVLSECLSARQEIDLMCIDVEGDELSVLRSNDWNLYRPEFLVVELLTKDFNSLSDNSVARFLISHGFEPIYVLYNSVIFKSSRV